MPFAEAEALKDEISSLKTDFDHFKKGQASQIREIREKLDVAGKQSALTARLLQDVKMRLDGVERFCRTGT